MKSISKFFWKRAVKREILSIAKIMIMVGGVLLVVSGVMGGSLMWLDLIVGAGALTLAGWVKHKLFCVGFLLIGLILYFRPGATLTDAGAILLVIAGALGLTSTLV